MDDQQWIQHLQEDMRHSGWTPVGPDRHGKGWIAGAVRFEAGSTSATGPTGYGETSASAVEETYKQVVGDLPDRPSDPFEHEFDGIPEGDRNEIRGIRADFHRHGYDLRWFHPTDEVWIMQWTPHGGDITPVYGQVEDVGEHRDHNVGAIDAARRAWAKFEGMRGGG